MLIQRFISRARVAVLLGAGLFCASCNSFLVDKAEINRLASSSGKEDAVLYTLDAGATAPTAYHVALVPRGASPDDANEVYVVDQIDRDDIQLHWSASDTLGITLLGGREFLKKSKVLVTRREIRVTVEVKSAR